MAVRYVSKPVSCDGSMKMNLPVAHAVMRTCQATGKKYWTVDADPDSYCTIHEKELPSEEKKRCTCWGNRDESQCPKHGSPDW